VSFACALPILAEYVQLRSPQVLPVLLAWEIWALLVLFALASLVHVRFPPTLPVL
jgi:hypothetical protein